MSRFGAFPLGSQVHLYTLAVLFQQVGEFLSDRGFAARGPVSQADPSVSAPLKSKEVPAPQSIENAHVLLFLGNNVTTDHISPAGSIARASAAAKYLLSKRSVLDQAAAQSWQHRLRSESEGNASFVISASLTPREFNSYGARRGNDAVMTRGTFASIKLQNRFIGKAGPKTLHVPSGQTVSTDVSRPHEDVSKNC